MAEEVEAVVRECFHDAQRSFAVHKRVIKRLSMAFEMDRKRFWAEFIRSVNRVLVIYTRSPAAERIVQFIASFAVGHATAIDVEEDKIRSCNMENLCSVLLAYLLERANARSNAVRFRSCQIISAVLTSLPDHAEISERLYEPLMKKLLLRARDRVPRVRVATISGLGRLQDGENGNDGGITSELVRLMCNDSSPSVRKAAMSFTVVTADTASALVSRCRDVREDVRRSAFRILATRVHPKVLPIATRVKTLLSGLQDRSKLVRTACVENLLQDGWLIGACEGNLVELIGQLDPETYQNEALAACRSLLELMPGLANRTVDAIDVQNLSAEAALVLRACCEEVNTLADTVFESLMEYVHTLEGYSNSEFILGQLLSIASIVDQSEEVGRQTLQSLLVETVLPNLVAGSDIVKISMTALRQVADPARVEKVVIDSIRKHSEAFKCEDDDDEDEEEDDEGRLAVCMRTMELVEALLLVRSELEDRDTIREVIFSGFTSSQPELRAISLRCLSLLCLREKTDAEAVRFLPLYVQVCANDKRGLQIIAIQSLVDFLLAFGLNRNSRENKTDTEMEIGADPEQDIESGTSPKSVVMSILLDNLFHSDGDMRTAAAEGLAKVLFCKQYQPEASILSKLLLLFFNPVTEDDIRIRQCLSVFFRAFSLLSYANRAAFEQVLMPTLKVIMDAPTTSPISTIDPVSITLYIFYITESGNSDELHEFCRTLGSLKLRLDCGAWTELDSIRSLTVKAVGYVAKIADRKEVYALRQFSTQIVKLSRADDPRKTLFVANENDHDEEAPPRRKPDVEKQTEGVRTRAAESGRVMKKKIGPLLEGSESEADERAPSRAKPDVEEQIERVGTGAARGGRMTRKRVTTSKDSSESEEDEGVPPSKKNDVEEQTAQVNTKAARSGRVTRKVVHASDENSESEADEAVSSRRKLDAKEQTESARTTAEGNARATKKKVAPSRKNYDPEAKHEVLSRRIPNVENNVNSNNACRRESQRLTRKKLSPSSEEQDDEDVTVCNPTNTKVRTADRTENKTTNGAVHTLTLSSESEAEVVIQRKSMRLRGKR